MGGVMSHLVKENKTMDILVQINTSYEKSKFGAGAGGTIGGSLANALTDPKGRETALIKFLATAANVTLLGVGGAFWGLVAGLAAHLLIHGKFHRKPYRTTEVQQAEQKQ